MNKFWYWTLGTFVAAVIVPCLWLPLIGVLIAAIVTSIKNQNSFEPKSKSTGITKATYGGSSTEAPTKPDESTAEASILVSVSCPDANPESRSKEFRDYVEYVTGADGLYEFTPEQYLDGWERSAMLVDLSPDEWRIKRDGSGKVVVDADWKFPFAAKNEEDWQLYLYSVKNHPELLKVGIAKDVLKRKEKYYSRCLKKWKFTKREAILIEALFKHTTYGLHSKERPRCNVGNLQRETVHPEIEALWAEFEECNGFSEIRRMSKDAAVATIEQIRQDVFWKLTVDELLLKYGITTFNDAPVGQFRGAVEVPHLMWQLRPYDNQKAGSYDYVDDPEIRESLVEEAKEEEAAIKAKCWKPEVFA